MNIRKTTFILYLVIMNNFVFAQSMNDTIFKNVILIQEKDVVKNNNGYLIDVVFNYKEMPVIFNNSKLSKHLFDNQLFKNKPYILIVPDSNYYDAFNKTIDEGENCCDMPLNINIYHQRKYNNNLLESDSLTITGNQPKLVFSKSLKDLKLNDNIIFYHTESFGSVCCPKDPKIKMKEKLTSYITSFEERNNVKLGDIYKKVTGKEGEHILYFTLSNLNKEQKLIFLQEISFWPYTYTDRLLEDIEYDSQIFIARSIKKDDLKLMSE